MGPVPICRKWLGLCIDCFLTDFTSKVSVLPADAQTFGQYDRRMRLFKNDGTHHLQRARNGQPQGVESQKVH